MKIRIVHTLRADWLYITHYSVSVLRHIYIYVYVHIVYTLYRVSVLETYMTSRYTYNLMNIL